MESERIVIRKAMAWDLCKILESSKKDTFTKEEVKELIHDYIATIVARGE